ncbi:MAG: hypothetical protein A2806_02540 [Candidatus Terrybacteria bacterium RIFCSPHIGHO2_01_FULL_48_17]|uniref:Sodium/calcium exchanger membrane region domain-containing protein n=1 Tax=Candidatus Terrybacteria bacterium RIFCSPHIGHO2_01_FULL_48_17 TaxID=1802362 RepID=A0A1G2PJU2_9BACT|nr:MAG: hypothetical protein A2806_02540 [Candidatus Terrybacteria bacterium RIFCSPHIGHO2_01_FULL_48_17]OHA51854.1 MAG: hypothetical protein A3A30_01530 [Candidatus Terrybacteria bacterium RIFCSPLOWO2_01_FULL_48_14]
MPYDVIIFIASLFTVIVGANLFVSAASSFARVLRLPEIVVGATVVSIATTVPEMFVSFFSGIESHEGVALGNILGSPLVNLGLIAGVVFIFAHPSHELESHGLGIRRISGLVAVSFAVLLMMLLVDVIPPLLGVGLILIAFAYLGFILWYTFADIKTRPVTVGRALVKDGRRDMIRFIIGSILLIVGAYFLVSSAATLARMLQIPEAFIGLTFIAIGTSLPELITALVSLVRRREELALGNLAGASLLTLTLAFGIAAVSGTVRVSPQLATVEAPLIVFFSVLMLLATLMPQRRSIFGATLVISYGAYLVFFGVFR